MMTKIVPKKEKFDKFSDSEDEMCTLKDDMDEYSLSKNSIFLTSPENKPYEHFGRQKFVEAIKKIQVLDIQNVSKKKLPRFGITSNQVTGAVIESDVIDETCVDVDSYDHSTP